MSILNRADSTLEDIQNSDGTMSKLIYDRQLYDKMVALTEKSTKAANDVHELNNKIISKEGSIGKFLTGPGILRQAVSPSSTGPTVRSSRSRRSPTG